MKRFLLVGVALAAVVATFFVGRMTGGSETPAQADIEFSQDMAVHHDQAIVMANLAAARSESAVRTLATAILVNQSREIGVLRGWLRLWGESQTSGHRHHNMPGMASTAELEELWRMTGREFDVRFLQLMTRHHQGGVQMAREAVDHARIPAVRDTARVMVVDQTEEIARMRGLMSAEGAEPLPPP